MSDDGENKVTKGKKKKKKNVVHFLSFYTIKILTLRVDSGKLLDVLTSLSVSHAILPRAVCFATSRPANHAICSFIDRSGYASGPIRRCYL